jgi:dolichol-phosphate mannosyltransferase
VRTEIQPTIAVCIPCYKATSTILQVLKSVGPEVSRIFVIDDACPDSTADLVEKNCTDSRLTVIRNETNLGVGGAVVQGYRAALNDDVDIIVKIDSDGQMDPRLVPYLVSSIVDGSADYAKGCRFYSLKDLRSMPRIRLFGNAALSIINKVTSGYWNIMDPTNGFTAIHRAALLQLPLNRISKTYFFESDMLCRLSTIRAVIKDVPMASVYHDEESQLNIGRVLLEFPPLYGRAFVKRVLYCYFLRDFNAVSLHFVMAVALLLPGIVWGSYHWWQSIQTGVVATTGTVMLAVLPLILGFQFLLGAVQGDMANQPVEPVQKSTDRTGQRRHMSMTSSPLR